MMTISHLNCPDAEKVGFETRAPQLRFMQVLAHDRHEEGGGGSVIYECPRCGTNIILTFGNEHEELPR
jgi:hypothetical protein